MPTMTTSVTHLAGPAVRLGPRIIQRCLVCGAKLCDSHDKHASLKIWSEGGLILFDGAVQEYIGEFLEMKAMPDDFCDVLVE